MYLIGLTGGIGSGKSLVSRCLRELGALVIDADQIARDVVQPGRPALHEILQEFGETMCRPDGSLDRKALGRLVFSNARELDRLNRIIQPYILAEIKEYLENYRRTVPHAVVILDTPLLFEEGLDKIVDEIWVVDLDYATQLRRIMERDALSEEEAAGRIASQLPLAEKVRLAHRVIDNRGAPEETATQVQNLWNDLT